MKSKLLIFTLYACTLSISGATKIFKWGFDDNTIPLTGSLYYAGFNYDNYNFNTAIPGVYFSLSDFVFMPPLDNISKISVYAKAKGSSTSNNPGKLYIRYGTDGVYNDQGAISTKSIGSKDLSISSKMQQYVFEDLPTKDMKQILIKFLGTTCYIDDIEITYDDGVPSLPTGLIDNEIQEDAKIIGISNGVKIDCGSESVADVCIYDSVGRLFSTVVISGSGSVSLHPGFYIVKVKIDNKISSKSIIVM